MLLARNIKIVGTPVQQLGIAKKQFDLKEIIYT